ncbi:MAG: tetratricopeptide repeat protein [Candidatus Omnitrophota bacterium]
MKKQILSIIVIGVLLIAFLISLALGISQKKAEINLLNSDLKNKNVKLSQLEKQVEGLNAEKSALAGARLSLEAKLANLEQDISNAREKETNLSKKLGEFAQEKKKLEDDLAQATLLMQDKLKSSTEENKKELTLQTKQYQIQKDKFLGQLESLNQKLKTLNQEKTQLEKKAVSASEVTAGLMQEKEKLDHYKLGLFYENNQNYAGAVEEYEKILKLDPRDANIYRRLANIYIYNIKDRERASFYAKGYAVLNDQKASSVQVGSIGSLTNVADKKIAPSVKPNDVSQKLVQKNKQKHTQNEDLNEALGTYEEKALKHYYNLAIIYENVGRYKEAAQEYEKILELTPDDADIHYNLGILYDDYLQKNEKAIAHYRRYLELCPDAKDAVNVREWMDEAREDLDWERKMR